MQVDGNTVTSSLEYRHGRDSRRHLPASGYNRHYGVSGHPGEVVIANDTADVSSAMDSFVSAYNAVMGDSEYPGRGYCRRELPSRSLEIPMIARLQEQLGNADEPDSEQRLGQFELRDCCRRIRFHWDSQYSGSARDRRPVTFHAGGETLAAWRPIINEHSQGWVLPPACLTTYDRILLVH